MHKQNLLKLSVMILMFSLHALSFGMFQVTRLERQIYDKKSKAKDQVISNDLIITIAATRDGQVKNGLHKVCKYLNEFITKTNPLFVGLPIFTAHQKDMNDIILFFSWHNKHPKIIASIKEKMISTHITVPFGRSRKGMWSIGRYECSWPCKFECDYPGKLRTKYIQQNENSTLISVNHSYKLPCDAEIALLFAALCKDEKSVEIIATKVKEMYRSDKELGYYIKMDLHKDLLGKLIEHDDVIAFELIAKCDPYEALNLYDSRDKTGDYDKPYLDYLMQPWYMKQQQEKKNKYIQIYRNCGGKPFEELEPKKQCIIA